MVRPAGGAVPTVCGPLAAAEPGTTRELPRAGAAGWRGWGRGGGNYGGSGWQSDGLPAAAGQLWLETGVGLSMTSNVSRCL